MQENKCVIKMFLLKESTPKVAILVQHIFTSDHRNTQHLGGDTTVNTALSNLYWTVF